MTRTLARAAGPFLLLLPAAAVLAQQPAFQPPQPQTPHPAEVWLDFSYAMPANSALLLIAIVILAALALAWVAYRLALRGEIKKGTHPNTVKSSVLLIAILVILVAAFLLLPTVGAGYFIVLAALLVFAILGLVLSHRVIPMWIVTCLVLAMIVVLLDVFKVLA